MNATTVIRSFFNTHYNRSVEVEADPFESGVRFICRVNSDSTYVGLLITRISNTYTVQALLSAEGERETITIGYITVKENMDLKLLSILEDNNYMFSDILWDEAYKTKLSNSQLLHASSVVSSYRCGLSTLTDVVNQLGSEEMVLVTIENGNFIISPIEDKFNNLVKTYKLAMEIKL